MQIYLFFFISNDSLESDWVKKEIYTADTGMYRLKKEAIFCVKSDMQEDSKTVEKKTEKSSSDVWFMVASLSFYTVDV